ncbi:hypothetical protein [Haloglycomyces albus]|uniref:hypothetical protein n=1 Tax=Haloglycomyces albus TaxID=526067 RepID=UPI00046D08AC|nr:hypothetical protein [Haloglycomyces albus]
MHDGEERSAGDLLTLERLRQLRHHYTRYRNAMESRLELMEQRLRRRAKDIKQMYQMAPELFHYNQFVVTRAEDDAHKVRMRRTRFRFTISRLFDGFDFAEKQFNGGDVELATRVVARRMGQVRKDDSQIHSPRKPPQEGFEVSKRAEEKFDRDWVNRWRKLATRRRNDATRLVYDAEYRERCAQAHPANWTDAKLPEDWNERFPQRLMELERRNRVLVDIYDTALTALDAVERHLDEGDRKKAFVTAVMIPDMCTFANRRAEAALDDRWDIDH